MNVIPISSGNLSKRSVEKKSREVSIFLPNDWWSIDVSLYSEKYPAADNAKLYPIKKQSPFGDLKVTHGKWSAANGDYRVRAPYRKDYIYYRDLKQKLVKYSVYPALIVVSAIIYFVSFVLSNINI